LCLGQHATHFNGEIGAMYTELIHLFGRNGSFEKPVRPIFSDSISAIVSTAKFYALPSKQVTVILSFIKLLKDFKSI
jgi:hypothetical protein